MAGRPCAKHKRFVRQCAGCVKKRETAERASNRAHEKRITELYDIDSVDYAAILEAQGGVCAICQRPGIRKRLAVDHDHAIAESGNLRASVRGALCRGCNYGVLGWLKDDPAALRRAIAYLKKPPARAVLRGR